MRCRPKGPLALGCEADGLSVRASNGQAAVAATAAAAAAAFHGGRRSWSKSPQAAPIRTVSAEGEWKAAADLSRWAVVTKTVPFAILAAVEGKLAWSGPGRGWLVLL